MAPIHVSEGVAETCPPCTFHVIIRSGSIHADRDGIWSGHSDPYTAIYLDDTFVNRTVARPGKKEPVWDEKFTVYPHHNKLLFFKVFDHDDNDKDDALGFCSLQLSRLISEKFSGELPLTLDSGVKAKEGDRNFIVVDVHCLESGGYGDLWIPHASFPPRECCRMTLFQDAHTDGKPVIDINRPHPPAMKGWCGSHKIDVSDPEQFLSVDNDDIFASDATRLTHTPRNAFEEIYYHILHAKHTICIMGWSVWAEMSILRRRPIGGEMLTTRELLFKKADEGVSVYVMVWDEKTSKKLGAGIEFSLMATHDEENQELFGKSKVKFLKIQRTGGDRGLVQFERHQTMDFSNKILDGSHWTHHQKVVICDAPALVAAGLPGPPKRRLLAFCGGLDITGGRWDTPTHDLFGTLQTDHKGDYYNPSVDGSSPETTPRQPWEDIHCKLEGGIAWDLLDNYCRFWKDHAPEHKVGCCCGPKHHIPSEVDAPVQGEPPFIQESQGIVYSEDHPCRWTCQLFRSADPQRVKARAVDDSIQHAYVHRIRGAKRFIFIENQYFIGSSQHWGEGQNTEAGSTHLVPLEIVRRIRRAIEEGERFAAYVIMPMFPEGIPSSQPSQEILAYQYATIEMMYRDIADAMKAKGCGGHPTDYLSFFCLGNREKGSPSAGAGQSGVSRRFMVYVHSKMLITDDEWILVGTANINQRSMSGRRDSEVAVGGFQPAYTAEKGTGATPRGRIHAMRMSLWAEHTGGVDPVYEDPASLECVTKLRDIAQQNWELYIQGEVVDLPSHLMTYPYNITADGEIGPAVEHFPDFPDAPVRGKNAGVIPPGICV